MPHVKTCFRLSQTPDMVSVPVLQLMTNLDFPAAVKELGEAVAYLKSSGASKVGVVGFCMGGALTFAAAQHAGVNAAAPFYGIPDPAICDVSKGRVG